MGFKGYFLDYWNVIDSTLLTLVLLVIIEIAMVVIKGSAILSPSKIRRMAAFGTFMLWIKLFYWMRLFNKTAHFITLIFNTIFELQTFGTMMLLILMAYTSAFYILNQNTTANPHNKDLAEKYGEFSYIKEFTGVSLLDAFIQVYMISLGDFNYDGYNKSGRGLIVYFFFLTCTGLILLVFMNMLIAIMGETFENV